jgi:PEP-CTERM/exosortase A-associated glycosyltransferase
VNQLHVISSLAQRVEEVAKREKPDILHAHSPALNGLAAQRVAQKLGLPVVYECRAFWEDAAVDHGTSAEWGLRYRLTRAMESRVFAKADAVTTICEGLRKDIIERGISADKVTVIPNAVDIDDFKFCEEPDDALLEELNLKGKTVLGFIGSFYAYEGISFLLDALPAVIQKHPNVVLLLVGGGPEESEIEKKVNTLNLQDHVIRKGRVPHSEVHAYYNLVDIFVYPRLAMRLTNLVTPLKPLEAMAQGQLVLASDVGGHREMIEHGKTGFLFQAGNSSSMVNAVSEILAKREIWQEFRNRGRKFVEEERNWPTSVARYDNVYRGIL